MSYSFDITVIPETDEKEELRAYSELDEYFKHGEGKNILITGAVGCHGVYHGVCFLFDEERSMLEARGNALREPFFIGLMKKYSNIQFIVNK